MPHTVNWSTLDAKMPGWRENLAAWEAKGARSQALKRPGTGRIIFPKGFDFAGRAAPQPVPPPTPEYGLGNLIRQGIDLTTFGMGKALAMFVAQKFLKKANCGCSARQACLDQLVPDVRTLTATDWIMMGPAIWKCARTRDDPKTPPGSASV
jgi:hypothetical protein